MVVDFALERSMTLLGAFAMLGLAGLVAYQAIERWLERREGSN